MRSENEMPSGGAADRAGLIEEAKNYEGDNGTARWPSLITDIAAALAKSESELAEARKEGDLDRAEQKLTEQAATIEAVRVTVMDTDGNYLDGWEFDGLAGEVQQALLYDYAGNPRTSAAPVKNRPEISHVTPTSEVSLHADAARAIKAEALREAADDYPWHHPTLEWLRARAVTLSTETTTDGEGQ